MLLKYLINGRKYILTAIVICTLLMLLIESTIIQIRNKMKTANELGRGRFLPTEYLENITINNKKQCSKERFLVYKCDASRSCGSWSNREIGIVSSFLLALLTNRVFIIHMTNPCELQQFLRPNVYNWNKCYNFLRQLGTEDVNELNYVDENIQDFDSNWTKRVIVLRSNAYLIDQIRRHKLTEDRLGWLLKTTNEEVIHLILHTLFRPNHRILNDAEYFHMNEVHGKHLVCGDIRKEKNSSIPKDKNYPRETPSESAIFDFLNTYDDYEKNVIVVTTDSDTVRQKAVETLGTYININETIIHNEKLRIVENSTTDACEEFYTALFEQHILSHCDTLVLSRSNFGTIAAYLRGVSDNLFIYYQNTNTVQQSNLTNVQTSLK